MTRLVSCYFGGEDWNRMARVLEFGARRHCPGWDVDVRRIDPPRPTHSLSANKVGNTRKLDWWAEQVQAASDGAQLLLIDTDTMILGPLDAAWGESFDLAYTFRDGQVTGRFPLNAGVIFLRVSDRVRAFMGRWREENRLMLADPRRHAPWYRRFGGMNQSALGKLLTEGADRALGVQLGRLPCSRWNAENTTWERFDPATTRIVHLKNGLRLAALAKAANAPRFKPLVRLWRGLEREALAAQGSTA